MTDHAASPLSAVVALNADTLDDLESVRMAGEARLRSLTDEEHGKGISRELAFEEIGRIEDMIDGVKALERDATRHLEAAMRRHELGAFVQSTPGLGLKTVARFLGETGPLHHRETVYQLYAYCGLHVVNGKAPRLARGQKLGYNKQAKTRAFLMAEPCVKAVGYERTSPKGKVIQIARSPYRDVYDEGREKYEGAVANTDYSRYDKEQRKTVVWLCEGEPIPDWMKHARAMRLVMKAIVADLWAEARKAHGLPTSRRYPTQELEQEAAD